jgi:hypothetical protein
MTTPAPPDAAQALEEKLRALHDEAPVTNSGDNSCWDDACWIADIIRQAHALGVAKGRAEGMEDAYHIVDSEMDEWLDSAEAVSALGAAMRAIRARAASTGKEGT